jgi:Family of unknown function (DUF6125)
VTRRGLPQISDADRAAFFRDAWWSHDGQWFLKAKAKVGLEMAMELNEDAVESIGRIEMKRFHALVGSAPVETAADFLPLVLAMHELVAVPAEGELDGSDAFVLRETECRVWQMTVAAGMEAITPGCRGSMRRRQGWATAFFPEERVEWTRTGGPPMGDTTACSYRFLLLGQGGV